MVKKFIEIFNGRKTSYGISVNTGRIREDGKNEYDSEIRRQPVTEILYQKHLEGIKPTLGIIAINEDNKCKFGCIDIDTYPVEHLKYIKTLKENNVPAIVFKSKSNGAHIYLFTKEWVTPSLMRVKLREIAALLGRAKAEIFPKQDYINQGDVGSFLNLPYDDKDNTQRYALDENENKVSLEDFYKLYDKKALTEEQLIKLFKDKEEDEDWVQAPPCLVSILKEKQQPGEMRNITFMNVAVYLKKRFPNEWKQKLLNYNAKYCEPPLAEKEIQDTIMKSLDKKDYNYGCKNEPLASFCNAKKCRNQKFGIGKGHIPIVIEEIQIYQTEPTMYKVSIDGESVDVKSEELNDPKLFANAYLRQIYKTFPSVPINLWREMIQEYLNQKLFVPDMAESLKVDVMLEELLLDYFKMTPGQNFESITVGNRSFVDHENKICYFKQISLENYLNKTSWKKKWFETSQLLKKFYTLKAHNGKVGNQKCRYWSLQKGTGENAKELIFESPTKVTPNKLKPAPYEK